MALDSESVREGLSTKKAKSIRKATPKKAILKKATLKKGRKRNRLKGSEDKFDLEEVLLSKKAKGKRKVAPADLSSTDIEDSIEPLKREYKNLISEPIEV